MTVLPIEDIVNTHAYPIFNRDSLERSAAIDKCKASLKKGLYCALPDFIQANALSVMAAEAEKLRPLAFDNNSTRNCYLQQQSDSSLPKDHARNLMDASCVRMIAYDLIPPESPLKAFYHSEAVRDFIAEIVDYDYLYVNEDPYQPANYVCYNEGDQSSWHFDSDNSFTMTLMVQAATSGGEFQMSPNSRSDTDQNYDHVADVLAGKKNNTIKAIGRKPGALCIFRGCNSLHRVSPVGGDAMRIMGVFVYEKEPGILGDPVVNKTIYGDRTVSKN